MGHFKLGRVSGASELRRGDKGVAANFPGWAACEAGPEGRKGKEKGLPKRKGIQTNEIRIQI
jgi:hypothetical protein